MIRDTPCPACGTTLTPTDEALICPVGHQWPWAFVARQWPWAFVDHTPPPKKQPATTKDTVQAMQGQTQPIPVLDAARVETWLANDKPTRGYFLRRGLGWTFGALAVAGIANAIIYHYHVENIVIAALCLGVSAVVMPRRAS